MSSFIKKIAIHPDHITPTLTMSMTMDHFFSILVAILGGILWMKVGYQWVFLFGAVLAVVNWISASQIRLKQAALIS